MSVNEIPDESKCVGTPINYTNVSASLVLSDAWNGLPAGVRQQFEKNMSLRVMVQGTRIIFYHETAVRLVWERLTRIPGLQDRVPELESGHASLVSMCLTPVRSKDSYRMSIIHILFNDVARGMVQPDRIVPELRGIVNAPCPAAFRPIRKIRTNLQRPHPFLRAAPVAQLPPRG
jgi:hypothetical protein